ncbi:hypothetical protein GCM10020331_025290 [Ectobacillus funiculus]
MSFYGRVFVEPERDQKGVYLQMYALNKGKDGNAIVGYADPNFDVKNGDIFICKRNR